MSARSFTAYVEFDPAKLNRQLDLIEKRINAALSGGGVGKAASLSSAIEKKMGGGSEVAEKSKGIFDKLKDISGNTFKMLGIGVSIAAILAVLTESSGVLQSTFKLLQTSVMLILRPIGDFIGYLLRPFIILFLTQLALPFYKYVIPFIKEFGAWWKEVIGTGNKKGEVDWFDFPFDPKDDLTDAFYKWVQDGLAGLSLDKIWDNITWPWDNIALDSETLEGIQKFFTDVDVALKPVRDFFDGVKSWFDSLGIHIPTLEEIWNSLVGFWTYLQSYIPVLTEIWATVSQFFIDIFNNINGTLNEAWQVIYGFFKWLYDSISGSIIGWFVSIKNAVFDSFKSVEEAKNFFNKIRNMVSKIWDWFSDLNPFKSTKSSRKAPVQRAFADGGIIDEPVVGIGQRTGTQFMFAERGNEVVLNGDQIASLMSGTGRQISLTIPINVNVNGIGNGSARQFAESLKPEMRRIIFEVLDEGGRI